MKAAPLFTLSYDLLTWLTERLEGVAHHPEVRLAVLTQARALCEAITLALQGFDASLRARDADEALTLLRLHLRRSYECRMLSEDQYKFVLEGLVDIGRQMGGWRRHLDGIK